MKKLVLSLSLVLAFSSATVAFAAIPQNIRIVPTRPMRHLNQKIHKANWLASISIWRRSCANASIRNVRLSKTHWMR